MPYAINSRFRFWITGFFQTSVASLTVVIYSSVEIIPAIMMQQICAQLEICMNRLMNLLRLLRENNGTTNKIDTFRLESKLVENCILHHVYIYRYSET